jgi:ABC-2 type transport system ATP-binding protein
MLNNSKQKVKDYSLGMKQRLSIAMSLINEPQFLMLDEPINGLDPEGIIKIRQLLLSLKNKGVTILMSSHILSEMSKLATYYGFIDNGMLIKEISAADLEKECSRSIQILTQNNTAALSLLISKGFNAESAGEAINIYGDKNPAEIVSLLYNNNITVDKIFNKEEDLEGYFINMIKDRNMIGGGK